MVSEPNGIEIIKTIKEKALSSVYLVKIADSLFIKKTIHKDFKTEIDKQKWIYDQCKIVRIPKIYSHWKEKNSVSFIMEYIPYKKRISLKTALRTIELFHLETEKKPNKFFRIYDFNEFYKDFMLANPHIPNEVKKMSKVQLQDLFCEVFESEKSILHGDFHKDQVFRFGNDCGIMDFCGSFYGPKILDYAYYFRHQKVNHIVFSHILKNSVYSLKRKKKIFQKAIILICIFDIAWLINRKKHEKKDFTKIIEKNSKIISKKMGKLKKEIR